MNKERMKRMGNEQGVVEQKHTTEQEKGVKAERNYKDTLFRMVFKEPKELLQLYNAVNGTNYTDIQNLEIVTLENAIYLNVKNDVAFVIGYYLNMYEQQASVNPNMPMRYLQYVAKEYEKLIVHDTLYSTRLVKVPTPNFIVFYNGVMEQPERLEMKLSDAFQTAVENPALELRVIQLNINVGYNKELMEKCKTLRDYALYVEKVRKYTKNKPLTDAVEQAVKECIAEGVLAEFLTKYRAEAISMSIFECDVEKVQALIRKELLELGHEEGFQKGKEEGLKVGIEKGIKEGIEKGIEKGIKEGLVATIKLCQELGLSKEDALKKLVDKFSLSEEEIKNYLNEYWN